ncbi:MAG: ABC transporter ATP-binding protein [Acidobacteriaceae bacterium]|nr:ABC transporter ATP-binding protein [Acidobacteriaceae bacterium]MBV9223700.1 ABC transporter ATP-binding protein [Acidobacteriaceae bacterium]
MNVTEEKQQPFFSAWRERLQALKNVPPVLRIVWDSGPYVVSLGLFFRVLVSLVPVSAAAVAGRIVGLASGIFYGKSQLTQELWWLVALEFGLVMAGNLFSRAIDYYDRVLADRYTRYVSIQVMEHASSLDLQTYEDPVYYDRLERARVQATDRLGMIQSIGRLFQQIITTAALSAAILWYSPWLLLLLVACLIPAFLGESHFAFLNYALNFRQTPVKRELDYLRQVGGSKEAAKELKLFGLNSFLTNRFTSLSDQILAQNLQLSRSRLIAASLLSFLSTGGYYSAYVWVIYKTVTRQFNVDQLVFLTQTIMNASNNISQIFSTLSSIADQALFLTDLLAFFEMRPTVVSKPNALPAPRPIISGFEFRNVSFRYPGTERKVLDRLNFRLEPGERIALIGQNGQGKTTIVKLMTRLYDPSAGQILLDGVDLRDYNIEDLRKEIGAIFQDFMKYEMTARENIAVGRIAYLDDTNRIVSAAEQSLADGVIMRLPRHYEQMLGRRFEGGVDLSGGEWQKIALARAYLREAQVLILDEPTAALDARAEYEVFERFNELTVGKMALFISHRFSTVRMAERIIVLENGAITEEGNHERLVSRGGRYAEMFELQAASYR